MPHDVLGRDHAVVAEIVGDVEQRRDEELVGGGALGLDLLAGAALRHQLRHEAALGADRHDDRVLDLLRLHQPEDLGAEILRPVGPADAAARDLAEAQVHALDPRRIDEDLVERLRQRQAFELAARELDRDLRLRPALDIDLVEVGAQRRLHRVDEVAQDAVLVQALRPPPAPASMRGDDFVLLAWCAHPAATSSRGSNRTWKSCTTCAASCAMPRQRRPTCSPANRARGSGAGSARSCGSARRRARPARPTAPARCSRRSRRRRSSPRGSRLPAAAWHRADRRRRCRRAPAPCRAARRRAGRRRRAGCGGSARPPPGSPCSPGSARAPTAGSGGRSSTP